MPKTKRAPLSLSLLLSLAANADNDRPDDAWESANGLPPVRTTVLIYIDATGLVTSKLYADGHGPSYTYTADGKLATRTWVRKITADCSVSYEISMQAAMKIGSRELNISYKKDDSISGSKSLGRYNSLALLEPYCNRPANPNSCCCQK